MKKKRPFTLLEIMIVIFLIGLIGSVIGYNMKGSLDEGKAFKTKQAKLKIKEVFELEIAKGIDPHKIVENPVQYLRASGIINKPEKMIYDGWGTRFVISYDEQKNEIKVISTKYQTYKNSKKSIRGKDIEEN